MIKRFLSSLLVFSISISILLVHPDSAHAFVSARGTFTADSSCPALSSIRRQTNPGNININPDSAYPLLGKNKQDATHYQIRIEGASPDTRWVEISCGQISDQVISDGVIPTPTPTPTNSTRNVLAASWQPSFCETRPNKPECISLTENRFDATSFSIHGLWPRPLYCNVPQNIKQLDKDGDWDRLPELELSQALREELAIKMPGYQSYLHRHEWYKHGTCYSETPEEYYQETILLLDGLNASEVRTLMAENLEQDIRNDQIDRAFETAFGVEDKFTMSCRRVNREDLIVELKINLEGDINSDTNIADLLAAASDVKQGCPIGQVDSAND